MKKSILGFALALICAQAMAWHLDPLGQCGNRSYYITRQFDPNSIYQIRVENSTDTITITTGAVVHDSIISLICNIGDFPYMRYRNIDNVNFSIWNSQAQAVDYNYANCGTLAININSLSVRNNIISFKAEDESQVTQYNVLGTKDGVNYGVLQSFSPTGKGSYSIPIFGGVAFGSIFLLALFSTKKNKWLLGLSIVLTLAFFSCKKESNSDQSKGYIAYKIQAVLKSGSSYYSPSVH